MPEAATEVNVSRVIDAPREVIFAALLDPEQIVAWWGPDRYTVPRDTIVVEREVGGRWSAEMTPPEGEPRETVFEIVELDEPSLLVLRSEPLPEYGIGETTTRIELSDQDDGTRVSVTGGPYPDAAPAAMGWQQSLGKLDRAVTG